ncbi:MAG TPA: hypothetical protein VGN69_08685 [Solirubrobacteraceae bacterium]|jgi:hypothetical protein|nr:hypothetical protein [Solirubrobacteraceae bacterium]
MRRLITLTSAPILALALGAPAALAANSGEGLYGSADDKVVTNAGFILIIFFPLFVFLMSRLQGRLDRRKQARRDAAKARAVSADWRGGW